MHVLTHIEVSVFSSRNQAGRTDGSNELLLKSLGVKRSIHQDLSQFFYIRRQCRKKKARARSYMALSFVRALRSGIVPLSWLSAKFLNKVVIQMRYTII